MSRSEQKACPLCDGEPLAVGPNPSLSAIDVNCRRCGPFTVARTLYVIHRVPPELKSRLSVYTRQCQEDGHRPDMLDTSNLESLAQRVPEPSPGEKVDKLLVLLVKRSGHPGAQVSFSAEWDYPLIDARNAEEAMFHANALVTQGYINKAGTDSVIVTHSGWGRSQAVAAGLPAPHPEPPVGELDKTRKWDAFVSHASQDKESVVEPLVRALEVRGLRVWYDRTALSVGDSLRGSIDAGLARSNFGIVILSPAFFAKPWPQWELDGLLQKEMRGEKVILPVWHRVGHDDVATYSLSLADRVAGSTSQGIEALADRLLEAIEGGPRAASREQPPALPVAKSKEISASERELLIAAQETNGQLIVFSTQQAGEFVAVGKRTFIDDHDPAVRARYLEALGTLRESGLVRHEGGQLFCLTGSGFDLARELAGERVNRPPRA